MSPTLFYNLIKLYLVEFFRSICYSVNNKVIFYTKLGVISMKELLFSKILSFNTYTHKANYHTYQRKGTPQHFFGYIEAGQCEIVSEQITITATVGDVFYIPKGLRYHSYWHSKDTIKFKSFGFQYLPENRTEQYLLQKIYCDQSIKALFKSLPTNQAANSALIGDFYSAVAKILPYMQSEQSKGNAVVEKAKNFIMENPTCNIPEIARHCLISEAALYNIFRKETNYTPNSLRQKTLCEKAVLLLSTTDLSVQNISDSLGFSSTSYFRKILFKHIGQTPRQIRKGVNNI